MPEYSAARDWLQLLLPVLGGGLMGAIVTRAFQSRDASKRAKRLLLDISGGRYWLPPDTQEWASFQLLYNGRPTKALARLTVRVENVSQRLIPEGLLLFTMGSNTIVTTVVEMPHRHLAAVEVTSEGATLSMAPLQPGDRVLLTLMLEGEDSIGWNFRGSDEVEVVRVRNPATTQFLREGTMTLLALLMGVGIASLVIELASSLEVVTRHLKALLTGVAFCSGAFALLMWLAVRRDGAPLRGRSGMGWIDLFGWNDAVRAKRSDR